MPTPSDKLPVTRPPADDLSVAPDEPPVVARLVVELRSDGSRTIARGAMEDATTGLKAAIEASGNTPLELALTLAKSLFAAPWSGTRFAQNRIRALLRR